jgi:tight adherence protein C
MEDSILHIGALLTVLAAGFFLVYGIWVGFLAKFFNQAKELDEQSKAMAFKNVVISNLADFNRSYIWPRYEDRISKRILNSGGLNGLTPEKFMAFQEISSIFFCFISWILINFFNNEMGMDVSYWWIFAFVLGGFFFPEIWLKDQLKKRHDKIIRDLPYNIDLLTLSVEAGMDFQAAVASVVEKGQQGPLTEELSIMLKHLRMGKTREEALRLVAERVNLNQLTSFISALVQADRLGTSLGKVLRIQSTQLRLERTQRAEKLANEAPVKMLLPLIACIFPTVFLILFGPIIYQFIVGGS